jgi:hypothetical protein
MVDEARQKLIAASNSNVRSEWDVILVELLVMVRRKLEYAEEEISCLVQHQQFIMATHGKRKDENNRKFARSLRLRIAQHPAYGDSLSYRACGPRRAGRHLVRHLGGRNSEGARVPTCAADDDG